MLSRLNLAMAVCCALVAGCASRNPPAPTERPTAEPPATTEPAPDGGYIEPLIATVAPPEGWRLDIKAPTKPNVKHYVWVSPSESTAFGVMKFSLPMPVPYDPVLWVFLSEMRRSEGAAIVLSKVWDRKLRGLRFEVEGGRYRLRTNFTMRGLTGWMVYAGTMRDQPVNTTELQQAETARESTHLGRPQ